MNIHDAFILYNLLMNKKKAKLNFKHNYFEIVEEGDYVECAISGKKNFITKLKLLECRLKELTSLQRGK